MRATSGWIVPDPGFLFWRGMMKEVTVKMNRGERLHPAARPGYHYATGPPGL